eukprot:scpid84446/ scgid4807/ 
MHFSALYGILDKAVMSMDLAGPVTQEAGGGFQRCISIALSPDSCSGGDFWAVLPGPVIWAVLFVINSSVLWTGDLLLLSQICGYSGPAIVDVYLSSPDGEVHDNVLVLGTNSNGAGEVETVDGGLQCIRIHTSTASSMEAVYVLLCICIWWVSYRPSSVLCQHLPSKAAMPCSTMCVFVCV